MQTETRKLYLEEINRLKDFKLAAETELLKRIKYHYFIFFIFLAILMTYLASTTTVDFLVFVCGTAAVLIFAFIVVMPYELYKQRKRLKSHIKQIAFYLEKNTVATFAVNAKRIAIAEEYEDEGYFYLIEIDENKVFYLYDANYELAEIFPCLKFEVYENDFSAIIDIAICASSELIQPIIIDKEDKWAYMKTKGLPENLTIENISFDELIWEYQNIRKGQL
jgi:hypothetical protein